MSEDVTTNVFVSREKPSRNVRGAAASQTSTDLISSRTETFVVGFETEIPANGNEYS